MERELTIKTGDGHLLYGTLTRAKKSAKKLVVFCHGFTGHRNEHIFFNGAAYFSKKGCDVFRFDFYSGLSQARHFEETSISQHGTDITTVLRFFKKKYSTIYIVGHSFGGLSLLFADLSITKAAIFWDASFIDLKFIKTDPLFKQDSDGSYSENWGMKIMVGEKFIEELLHFPSMEALLHAVHIPCKFIGTGKGLEAKKYYRVANKPKAVTVITAADHNFNALSAEEQLFQETYQWIKKYS